MAKGSLATHFVKSFDISGLLGFLFALLGFTVLCAKESCQCSCETCLFQTSDLDNFGGKELKKLGCS